jgi:hypothetical protein
MGNIVANGVGTTLVLGPAGVAPTGDSYRIEVTGSTLNGYYRSGGVWTRFANTTDTTYSTGKPGFYNNTSVVFSVTPALDNFVAGDF